MRAIIDPDEARRFAAFLESSSAELRQLNSQLSNHLTALHAKSWKDERYRQFQKKYEMTAVLLLRFLDHSVKYSTYLKKKAAPIERYLRRKF